MKKLGSKVSRRLTLSSEKLRDLRNVGASDLRRVAGGTWLYTNFGCINQPHPCAGSIRNSV
jgi:hypothetical protein